MYKVDLKSKTARELKPINFRELEVKEKFDIEIWVRKNPGILGENLLVISEQTLLPSGR
ncbi:MAG: hypothetical protein PWQ59_233 [Thermoanaerobacterium sp.]|jgi:hypothetical protein|nr:hypothetical protein [Thermoanaerobacterium sp.]MDK2811805.1 hypothetical protein [Petrotoga sp.]